MLDKQTAVSTCCHESAKQIAVLEQKLQFMGEQMKMDQEKAQQKEL